MAKAASAITKAEPAALAAGATDELADILGDYEFESDGLEELGGEDIKIGVKVSNFKGLDENGEPIPPNVFYDTVDETTQKTIDASLLTYHKTNEWREFDKAQNKSITHCRSFDRVTGEMLDGTRRSCNGCPDQEWTTSPEGKRTKRCGMVYNLIGIERLTQKAFILRARRTAVEPLRLYLNKHFIGRRVTPQGTKNYALFSFATKIGLKMETRAGTSWAVPTFERGDAQSRTEILAYEKNAIFFRESLIPVLEKAEKHDVDAGEPDTSFDTDKLDEKRAESSGAPNRF